MEATSGTTGLSSEEVTTVMTNAARSILPDADIRFLASVPDANATNTARRRLQDCATSIAMDAFELADLLAMSDALVTAEFQVNT